MIRRTASGEWQFLFDDGTWRSLKNPHGSATARQLLRLNHQGRLSIGRGQITKLEAAQALDLDAPRDDDIPLDGVTA